MTRQEQREYRAVALGVIYRYLDLAKEVGGDEIGNIEGQTFVDSIIDSAAQRAFEKWEAAKVQAEHGKD